ncbi:MAG TPA: carbohydrate porin [Phycisphaerae bacterium]|nr:carbohydrate porin [Phycisphaerae bacterium]HOJ74256.1 carbohydrate porin [Phycisphaerae bacterium]HOM51335.1 carbohydrate porin [Phycisphaerae bacterium]HON65142.1 carbohydrate porin [Phycisphaerae bacterium]HOQ86959.1 carbohydrate porin [Phycisphaerae bacterium]
MVRSLAILLLLTGTSAVLAQDNNEQTAPPADAATETAVAQETTAETESAPPARRYGGDLWTRSTLTGDWGGLRDDLADIGITLDVGVTQIMQGNAHGGVSTKNAFRYSGSTDYTLTLDTAKMGLWKGGTILLNAETKWGDGIQNKVGSLLPVNLDAFKPAFGEGCMMTLSEYILFQSFFDGKLVFIAGKLDGSRAFDRNLFANDERTQFMNLGFRNNPIIGAFAPYTTLGAGFVLNLTDWLSTSTAVVDAEGRAKTTGFETAFHGETNTSVVHEWSAHVKPFGLDGNQRIGMLLSCMDYNHLQPISPFRQTGPALYNLLGPKLFGKIAKLLPYERSDSNCGLYYNFDQYLYQEAEDRTQGIGVFGRFGWARQQVNPIAHFYSIGVGGKGVISTRDHDTFGIGYYFADLSNDMPYWFHSEQGIEAYYNIQITPWLHISPDLQVIVNPGGTGEHDVALVYGLRVQMAL